MSEDKLQRSVARLLDGLGWTWFHPVNEGKRTKSAGGRAKASGMKRGVPDVLIFEKHCQCVSDWGEHWCSTMGFGVAIELKYGRGKTTPEQDAWMEALRERGWLCVVARTMGEVIEVLRHVRPLNRRRIT